ncbi:MAG: hypothetical protein C4529_12110, partial [Deltaproteobacteria bacterium]
NSFVNFLRPSGMTHLPRYYPLAFRCVHKTGGTPETLSAQSLDSILTSLKEVRMVELAVVGKRYRVVSDPDKVATAVFRLLGMPSPRRVSEVEAPPDTQEVSPA